jgi:hypothetical protein
MSNPGMSLETTGIAFPTPSVTILVEYGRPECTFARDTRASGRRPVIDTYASADTVHD